VNALDRLTLRKLLGDDPRGLDLGDLADKPFSRYTADDWRTALPLIEESTELLRGENRQLRVERERIERERGGQ
jgi:hypothetical protein